MFFQKSLLKKLSVSLFSCKLLIQIRWLFWFRTFIVFNSFYLTCKIYNILTNRQIWIKMRDSLHTCRFMRSNSFQFIDSALSIYNHIDKMSFSFLGLIFKFECWDCHIQTQLKIFFCAFSVAILMFIFNFLKCDCNIFIKISLFRSLFNWISLILWVYSLQSSVSITIYLKMKRIDSSHL